ncbi:hypothetical protein SNE40_018376 [Patella caerulea]|uniref:Uncharacterized protein n=1 Tax=Patella caerulea TaxID=87958 RepID=A0AAN8PBE1_PATCE
MSDASSESKRGQRRDRESECETPKPDNKINKMDESPNKEVKLDFLMKGMADIKRNQESMRHVLEAKIDSMRLDLLSTIDSKMKTMKDEIIAAESVRVNNVSIIIQSRQSKIHELEERPYINQDENNSSPIENNNITIVAYGIQCTENENISKSK